jgi:spermidine synthase
LRVLVGSIAGEGGCCVERWCMNHRLRLLFLLFIYFFSGVASLIYQMVWQRLALPVLGGDILSISVIVAAFMTGLGLGSFLGGLLADKLHPRMAFMLFGSLELAIALLGWCSDDVSGLIARSIHSARSLWFVFTAIPCTLMGLALPVVTRCCSLSGTGASRKVGFLYASNTAGAALGALATTWALLPLWGLQGALQTAATLNLCCGVLALTLSFVRVRHEDVADVDNRAGEGSRLGLPQLTLLYGTVGFLAIGLEIVWFRSLGAMAKSTGHTMGSLLAIYLALTALGGAMGALNTRRVVSPALLLGLCGVAAGFGAWGLPIALDLIHTIESLHLLKDYLASYEPIDTNTAVTLMHGDKVEGLSEAVGRWTYPAFHFIIPFLLMALPIALLGAVFPLLHQLSMKTSGRVARHTGFLMAGNIFGCLLGSLAVTLWLLPTIHTSGCLRVFSWLGVLFLCTATWMASRQGRLLSALCAAVVAAFTFALIPSNTMLWASVHGAGAEKVIVKEDSSGLSLIKLPESPTHPEGKSMIFVNGIGQSWVPFSGVHTLLGMLPVVIHPNPERIGVIGLGSGDTLFALLAYQETKVVTCMEIAGGQRQALQELHARLPYAPLHEALTDPRVEWITGDARKHLLQGNERYDIIEADAVRPTSAHAGALYSREFFELVLSRLKPGGMAVSWAPSERVIQTFGSVFPYVLNFGNLILIGSPDPITLHSPSIQQRLSSAYLLKHYEMASVDVLKSLLPVIGEGAQIGQVGPEYDRTQLTNINTDHLPKDEMSIPALWGRWGVK